MSSVVPHLLQLRHLGIGDIQLLQGFGAGGVAAVGSQRPNAGDLSTAQIQRDQGHLHQGAKIVAVNACATQVQLSDLCAGSQSAEIIDGRVIACIQRFQFCQRGQATQICHPSVADVQRLQISQ